MKKKKFKAVVLDRLSSSLAHFYPEKTGQFLCPTCLQWIPVTERHRISEAHIVPRAAGGKLVTLACASCNSTFGHQQDKWFGEFLYLKNTKKSLFHTRHQKGHFSIGGQRVSGEFTETPDGTFEFYIYRNKGGPDICREIQRQIAAEGSVQLSVPMPLLENQALIKFGALTSAYLLWFRELGYSWALQRHLDIVRETILHPKTAPFPNCAVVSKEKSFEHPWIGIGKVGNEMCLVAAIGNYVVLFPPADCPDLYSRLPTDFNGLHMQYQALKFYAHHQFDVPVGVVFEDRLVVRPDILITNRMPHIWLFPKDGSPPKMLYPVTNEEFQRSAVLPNAVVVKISDSNPKAGQ